MAAALRESGIDPRRLELEVSEAVVIDNKLVAAAELGIDQAAGGAAVVG